MTYSVGIRIIRLGPNFEMKAHVPPAFLHVVFALVTAALVFASSPSTAAQTLVVAFGASQTFGKGVSRSEAYPAQLEQLLRKKGYNVRVINSGVNGQTTGAMLRRLNSSVSPGTNIVIFQPGSNDERKGLKADRAGNILEIRERLSTRGIKVIMLPNTVFRSYPKQHDGQHLTAAGYRALAQSLVSKVTAAMSR